VIAVIGGPSEFVMMVFFGDSIICPISRNIDIRERLAHLATSHIPLDATRARRFRVGFLSCCTAEASLLVVGGSVRPPAITGHLLLSNFGGEGHSGRNWWASLVTVVLVFGLILNLSNKRIQRAVGWLNLPKDTLQLKLTFLVLMTAAILSEVVGTHAHHPLHATDRGVKGLFRMSATHCILTAHAGLN